MYSSIARIVVAFKCNTAHYGPAYRIAILKGHNMQHSGHMGLVRAIGKVLHMKSS